MPRSQLLRGIDKALLSAEEVGAMLGYPARHTRETIALAPGFPSAIRLPLDTDGKTQLSTLAPYRC